MINLLNLAILFFKRYIIIAFKNFILDVIFNKKNFLKSKIILGV